MFILKKNVKYFSSMQGIHNKIYLCGATVKYR